MCFSLARTCGSCQQLLCGDPHAFLRHRTREEEEETGNKTRGSEIPEDPEQVWHTFSGWVCTCRYLFVFECKYVSGECVCVPEHVFVKAELEADAEIMDGCWLYTVTTVWPFGAIKNPQSLLDSCSLQLLCSFWIACAFVHVRVCAS